MFDRLFTPKHLGIHFLVFGFIVASVFAILQTSVVVLNVRQEVIQPLLN